LLDLPLDITAEGASFAEVVNQLEREGGTELSGDQGLQRLRISELFAVGKAFQIEHTRPSGARLLVRASPLEDGCWVLLVTDVTTERTAVAALRESEERYRQLVEHSPDLISIHKDGRFLFVNPAGARLVGVSSPEELIGRRALDFVHPDYHEEFRNSGTTVQAGGAGFFYEFRALREDGTEFDVEGTTVEFSFRGGPAILSVVRDITLRKLAQAQLVQTSKLVTLGELAAGITHELNQPLNVIRMAADSSLILMEQGKTDAEFERDQFERISAQAVRMADIISHMKSFSRRQDDDDHDGGRALIDPAECVTASVSMVHDQYVVDNVTIDVDLPESVGRVYGNSIRLEQVILNLLTNAHDALVLDKVDPDSGRTFKAETSGRIKVSVHNETRVVGEAENPKDGIVIHIEDNGGGIPGDVLERVFDPFFTTKRTGQGTGLGLAIGYSIVDSMGGRIVASNVDDGARFEVWLPIANDGDIVRPFAQAERSARPVGLKVVN
ncbi:MAG: PAS domain S-box protein, partial [Alphaproteobacteria bacterium]|nr:PAS domain S-box protein [Alphaproteobacteria bacterium]